MIASKNLIGQRIAAARMARHLSQAALAERAHISLSLLRKLEQGSRNLTDDVLFAISDALGIEPERLTLAEAKTGTRVHAAIPRIRHAVDAYDLPEDGPTRSLDELHNMVESATDLRVTSQYSRLGEAIPELLGELSRALDNARGAERARAAELFALAYRSADAVAYKFGYHDLSGRMVELMRWSAAISESPVLVATIAYVRTETFFASRNLAPGLRALQAALRPIPSPRTPEEIAAVGALHMRAAVVAARLLEDTEVADEHMRQARRLAGRVPEGIYSGTAFGPDSMRVHEVSVAVELGDGVRAVEAAESWEVPASLPAERRSHFYIELARAQLWLGQRDASLQSLQEARRIAPQHVREHRQVRDALATLIRLYTSPPHALLSYAEWAKAI
ncbi:helix-turn-helix transcriptional regulator [Actinocorallia sp. A-T 12471]|uniref:helix-turn-helix domain-containing protein n=1 Tax=Actinocorallia sp. A-T 12471 TaxID=3089813 RepID=UPI0029D04B5B|nr:helix-turn-helix transcriptional regulator [Actinocorallia sp. A-T 12471]MDX6743610.1 helix-turn-helix transcriptional regulator [Actinocorallia sp. A-T 12471]